MAVIGCASTEQRVAAPDGAQVPAVLPDTGDLAVTDDDTAADLEAENNTEVNETDTVAEAPGELIENAKAFCAEGNFAAADSSLKEAITAMESVDEESESEWFPSSQYVDDIVSLYSEKMPPQYPVPDEIAQTAFQRQMARSLDSMRIMPAESLSIATMGCQKNLTYDVPMVWNDRVQRAVFFYVNNRKITVDRWFPRASYYLPAMRTIFADSGLPQDLAYLPLIESGFNPLAYSYAFASGIWQFITSTGRLYGLRHSYWLDERRDPIKSTRAAVSYLKKLFGDFGHWHLALAAYNCGENTVSRSLGRSQQKDFWKLKRLPSQTKNYVPSFLAALTIAKNPRCFGVITSPADTFSLDTVLVNDCIPLDDIAQAVGIAPDSLKKMNPHLLRWCTPPDVTDAVLYLPRSTRQKFADFRAQLPEEKMVRWCRYQVKENDNIVKIARQFRIPADGIKAINRLKNDRLAVNQILFLPVPDGTEKPVAYYVPPELPKDDDGYGLMTRYRIQKGDCISKIGRRFHVSCAQLYRWNHLSSKSKLRPGRLLVVRPAPPPETTPTVIAANAKRPQQGTYVVQLGDTPFSIARRAGLAINDLLAWNRIEATQPIIHIGDTLRLAAPVPEKAATKEEEPSVPASAASSLWQEDTAWTDDWSSAFQENRAPAGDAITIPPVSAGGKAGEAQAAYYTVKKGDTLQRIASAFGVSVEQLYKDNDLNPDSTIVPGKVIKVVKAAER
jgi:membrane-bound lytic murein transglycosylase D